MVTRLLRPSWRKQFLQFSSRWHKRFFSCNKSSTYTTVPCPIVFPAICCYSHITYRRSVLSFNSTNTSSDLRKNHELNELIGNADIVRFIKSRRIAWLGHVTRMDGIRMPRRILEWKPIGRRIRGRPRKRWIEDVEEDIQTMGIRGWRKLSKEKTEWKKITEKAKTHSGL